MKYSAPPGLYAQSVIADGTGGASTQREIKNKNKQQNNMTHRASREENRIYMLSRGAADGAC